MLKNHKKNVHEEILEEPTMDQVEQQPIEPTEPLEVLPIVSMVSE